MVDLDLDLDLDRVAQFQMKPNVDFADVYLQLNVSSETAASNFQFILLQATAWRRIILVTQ